ncbi:MAG: 7-cyano-7-deazaguanine synthase QueC [Kiritimatiellae bacterium]|nr:7-cyano-7-deazaguanine synthase QueC [Kiritimatiellia bacterium]
MKRQRKAVVLLSGGVDSSTLLHYVKKRLHIEVIYALAFRYGQRHVRELKMARWQAACVGVAEYREVVLSFLGNLTRSASALTDPDLTVPDWRQVQKTQPRVLPTYVPNRNMLMLSVAVAWAETMGVDAVYYGAHAGDRYGYWDCTPKFVGRLNRVLGLNPGTRVRVFAPFVEKSKAQIVKIGLALGVDYSHTWTCYRGGRYPCGRCPSCNERRIAFHAAGCEDPLVRRSGRRRRTA